ncbi:hypothetical protein GA0061093_103395 [Rhodococcus qingshengii]|nr:hypothetical protein GA0061093_103395 [Rhodococcus qingshengii]
MSFLDEYLGYLHAGYPDPPPSCQKSPAWFELVSDWRSGQIGNAAAVRVWYRTKLRASE